jgi:hypothetical protein
MGAVDGFGQYFSYTGLAGSPWSIKQKRMRNPTGCHCILQRGHGLFLPYHLAEFLWSIKSI